MATSPFYVVFVPGITGTSLVKSGNILDVWWEQVAKAVVEKDDPKVIELLTQSGLEPGQPLQDAGTTKVYGPLIDYFTGKGFRYVVANQDPLPEQGNVLIGFGYDWRQSNVDSASALNDYLNFIASAQKDAPIWLLAHSMGGLVSRYVLESGDFSSSASYKIQGLVTAATPHIGAPLALSAVTGQANQSDLLNPQLIETLVDEPKFLSAFQLLVAPGTPFVFENNGDTGVDIYSGAVFDLLTGATPNGFGAPSASFASAQAFWNKLNPNSGIPYYVTFGSGLATTTSFDYVPSGSTPVAQLVPQINTAADGGDGTVPVWSTSLVAAQASFDAGQVTHAGIVTSTTVLDQIFSWITGG